MSEIAALDFHALTFVEDHDGVLVGRPSAGTYVLLPADGAQLLRRLADGMPVQDAASWYQTTYSEAVDIADFLTSVRELGFVRDDGEEPASAQRPRYQRLGALAFSPPFLIGYLAIATACAVMIARHPGLRPLPGNVLFVRSLIVVQLVIFVTQLPALAWHEWFHVLAGRRLGLPTRLTVGRRLYFVVFETQLDGLLSVDRRRRYLPFMAGLIADGLLFSVLTLAAAAAPVAGLPAWAARLALAIGYVTLLRMAWQLCFFLRTDSYYALTTMLGCPNLAEAAGSYLRFLRAKISRRGSRPWREVAAAQFSPRDRAVAPWFALATVIGTVGLFALAGVAVLPAVIEFVSRLWSGISSGQVSGLFWDSAGSLAITLTQLVVFPLLVGRNQRKEART